MAAADKHDDDDYVAKLLAEDAKKASVRYASQGLSALLPKQRSQNALKPNTRFLSHLVKEADNHNAALRRKEELRARDQLRHITSDRNGRPRDHVHIRDEDTSRNHRRKEYGDEPELDRKRKRQRLETGKDDQDRQQNQSPTREASGKGDGRSHQRKNHHSSRKHRRKQHESDGERRDRRRRRREIQDGERHSRAKPSEDSTLDKSKRPTQSTRSPSSSRSLSRSRSRSPSHLRSSATSNSESIKGPATRSFRDTHESVRVRGRGAHKISSESAMDHRFSSNYDPTQDLDPGTEEAANTDREDWDLAMEAVRDRAMWKRKQADRLREAGWDDEQIKKWERNGSRKKGDGMGQKDIANVRWSKKGEAREWDRGKE